MTSEAKLLWVIIAIVVVLFAPCGQQDTGTRYPSYSEYDQEEETCSYPITVC